MLSALTNIFGVILALFSGVVTNIGTLLQKKAVNMVQQEKLNELRKAGQSAELSDIKLNFKTLCLSRTWLLGFSMQLILGTGTFIASERMIGPSLPPALGSFGLIVIVLASCMLKEKFTWLEYFGIVLIVGAVVMLIFANMIIGQDIDYLETAFVFRVCLFTAVIAAITIGCKLWSFRRDRWEGTVLALNSGLFVALSNYWISPLTNIAIHFMTGSNSSSRTYTDHPNWAVGLYLAFALIIVVVTNVMCIVDKQLAFRVGNAATMIPITHIPSHLSSPIIYALVFFKIQPTVREVVLMWMAIVLLLICTVIFGKREAMMAKNNQSSSKVNPSSSYSTFDKQDKIIVTETMELFTPNDCGINCSGEITPPTAPGTLSISVSDLAVPPSPEGSESSPPSSLKSSQVHLVV